MSRYKALLVFTKNKKDIAALYYKNNVVDQISFLNAFLTYFATAPFHTSKTTSFTTIELINNLIEYICYCECGCFSDKTESEHYYKTFNNPLNNLGIKRHLVHPELIERMKVSPSKCSLLLSLSDKKIEEMKELCNASDNHNTLIFDWDSFHLDISDLFQYTTIDDFIDNKYFYSKNLKEDKNFISDLNNSAYKITYPLVDSFEKIKELIKALKEGVLFMDEKGNLLTRTEKREE